MVDQIEQRMRAREWSLLLVLSGLWGSSFFFFKVLVAELPPFTVVLGRVGLAALALNLLLIWRGQRPISRPAHWRDFAIMALMNNVAPFSLIVFGETRIASGLASILNATTPIFALLAAHVLTEDERLTWPKTIGVLFAIAGVITLVGPGVLGRAGGGDLLGEAACLLAALSYALAGIYGRRFRGVSPLHVATGQVTASTLILIPLAALVDQPWRLAAPSVHVWLAFVGIALLCTALAYLIHFRILAASGATNLLLVTFLLPVSALLLGAAFLGEAITPRSLGGMALIGLGLVAIDGRLGRVLSLSRPAG